MTNDPLVSILIPTYNRASLISDAIESAIKQTYNNIEIIISDNNSEDNTEEICKQYVGKDNRIKYYKQNQNIGLINNTNFLIEKVKGDFIVWLCDDDWLDKDYVEKCIKFLVKNPDYSFVSPRTILYKPNKKKIKTCDFINLESKNIESRLASFIKKFPFADIATGVFRKKIIDEMFKTDNTFYKNRYGEDSIFIIKYLFAGKGKIINSTHHNKRENGYTRDFYNTPKDVFDTTGITLENWDTKLGEIFIESIINDNYYKQYYSTPEKLIPIIKEATKNLITYRSYKELIKYMIKHPFFIKRKAFYNYLYKFLRNKINEIYRAN